MDETSTMSTRELSRTMTTAAVTRKLGWTVGTRIVGDEGYGPEIVRITAIGMDNVLAITETLNGEPPTWRAREGNWTWMHRDWREVAS